MSERIFNQIVSNSPSIEQFIEERTFLSAPKRIESKWRPNNDVYTLETSERKFILKRINQGTWQEDIDHQIKLWAAYPDFLPRVFLVDGPVLIMEYVEGEDLTVVMKRPYSETHEILQGAGENLRNIYQSQEGYWGKSSALNQISYTFKYREFDPSIHKDNLTRVLPSWENSLTSYPGQIIHNDLSTGNIKITIGGKFRSVDPRADVFGIKDVAKDLGRLLAGVSCATHDNGYSLDESLDVIRVIGNPWKNLGNKLAERVAFYISQSYLSFSRWDMDTIAKEELFLIGIYLLDKGPKFYRNMDYLNNTIIEALSVMATRKK